MGLNCSEEDKGSILGENGRDSKVLEQVVWVSRGFPVLESRVDVHLWDALILPVGRRVDLSLFSAAL